MRDPLANQQNPHDKSRDPYDYEKRDNARHERDAHLYQLDGQQSYPYGEKQQTKKRHYGSPGFI